MNAKFPLVTAAAPVCVTALSRQKETNTKLIIQPMNEMIDFQLNGNCCRCGAHPRILTAAIKTSNSQMLFDPFKKRKIPIKSGRSKAF